MNIKLIEKDIYEKVIKTTITYSLKKLETELANNIAYNETIESLREQLKDVPEDLKFYVNIPLDIPIDTNLIDLIKELKSIDG